MALRQGIIIIVIIFNMIRLTASVLRVLLITA